MSDKPLIVPLAGIRWLDVPSIGERSIFQMFSPSTPKDQDWHLAMREGLKDKEAPVKTLTAPCKGVLDRLDLPMAQRTLICRPPIPVEAGDELLVILDMNGFHLSRNGRSVMHWELLGAEPASYSP
jgi:hypothetical protein